MDAVQPAWCAPEIQTLSETTCVADEAPRGDGERRTLVVFLHGVIAPKTTWQWTQERAMARAAKAFHVTVIMPQAPYAAKGPQGMGAGFAWPTAQAAQKEHEARILADLTRSRRELEARAGRPFDDVFVMGFSSGAYYAASLALRGAAHVDGYGLFAGGATLGGPTAAARAPIYVGVAAKDGTTAKGSRGLAASLAAWGWPHLKDERAIGHMFDDVFVGHALAYLRRAKAPGRRTAHR